jgi:hypothetical protein
MSNFDIKNDIENNFSGYSQLINLYELNKDKFIDNIDIGIYGWFSANICSMLGAVLTKLQDDLNEVTLTVYKNETKNILERNGFLSFFGYRKINDYYDTTIPYQVLSSKDDRYFNDYVFNKFLNKSGLPDMTKALKKKLMESIYEIFINAKMHSRTEKIFVCGQFFPANKRIEFMITDTGLGIRNVVNNTFGSNLSAVQAIKWALKDRHTTKQGVSGGIGLSLLYEFVKKNRGKIQIVSNKGFWELNDGNEATRSFDNEFPGTMVNISIRADDQNSYRLADEIIEEIF